MMKKSKILININNLNDISEYKKNGISHFLFAMEDFSIGYESFKLDRIPNDAYLLINRVLDNEDIEKIKNMKNDLLKYKGIMFEDLGIYNIFKDDDIELIWFQNHFGTSTSTLNYYLDKGIKSVVISNELTKEEIKDITNNIHGQAIFNVFGKNQIMYSRRTLISNYNKYFHLNENNDINIYEKNTDNNFFLRESKKGTIAFNNEYFNYIDFSKELDDDKIYFYLILNLDLTPNTIENIINGESIGNDGFLNKKTVYKLKDYD